MTLNELRVRALAAASAARLAGLLETSNALIRLAELCENGEAPLSGDLEFSDTLVWCLEKDRKGQSIH
jgi:hypothetical protein